MTAENNRHVRPRVKLGSMDNPEIATAYNKMMSKVPYVYFARRILKQGKNHGKLLDIACGPGQLLIALARKAPGLELNGLDISQHLLGVARTNLEKQRLSDRIALHEGSCYELPFADGSFDIVVNTNALHYVEDRELFFNEIARVLKNDGVAVISDYRRDAPGWVRQLAYMQTRFFRTTRNPLEGFGAVIDACYTKGEVEQSLERSNVSRWEVRQSYFLPLSITIYGDQSIQYSSSPL